MATRLRRITALIAILSAVGLVGAGCGAADEVVAMKGLPDGGTSDGGPVRCLDSTQCPQTPQPQFCSKTSCEPTEMGTCQPKPMSCDVTSFFSLDVCGCSGVRYWSDCLRQQQGEPFVYTDPRSCPQRPCGSTIDAPCPAGSYCAMYQQTCAPAAVGQGACVVLPDPCPTDAITLPGVVVPKFLSCATGGCMDYCSAIRVGAPFHVCSP